MDDSNQRGAGDLFDALAADYDEHFAQPHRRAYDQLSWELCSEAWRDGPLRIVDVGCGVGRWSEQLLKAGHSVIGIEPSKKMAQQARRRLSRWLGDSFILIESRLEDIDLPVHSCDVAIAMGSLQYTQDPASQLNRIVQWVSQGGRVSVLVDSLVGLVTELRLRGNYGEAAERLETRTGVWRVGDQAADLHLFDADSLRTAAEAAGLVDVSVRGLLLGFSIFGRDEAIRRLETNYLPAIEDERQLSLDVRRADLGKQLLMRGSVPTQ